MNEQQRKIPPILIIGIICHKLLPFIISLVIMWGFMLLFLLRNWDIQTDLALSGRIVFASGRVTAMNLPAGFVAENSRHVLHEIRFIFMADDGNTYTNFSISPLARKVGDSIQIEYCPSHPKFSRIRGTFASQGAMNAMTVISILGALSIALLITPFWGSIGILNILSLLRSGKKTTGTVVSVYSARGFFLKFTYDFQHHEKQVVTMELSPSYSSQIALVINPAARDISLQIAQRNRKHTVLYDADDSSRAIMPEFLPGKVLIEAKNHIIVQDYWYLFNKVLSAGTLLLLLVLIVISRLAGWIPLMDISGNIIQR